MIKVTEEQYKIIQELSNTEKWLKIMLNRQVGYYKTSELVKAYRTKNIEVVAEGEPTHL